jgi:glucose-6-phosphate isomerase
VSRLELRITDSALLAEARARTEELVDDKVASSIAAKDATLWGPDAESTASVGLNWVDPAETSRGLVARITELGGRLAQAGVHRVVLAGTGGSSLAPEVSCRTAGVPLIVLDTTDAGQVEDALAGDLAATVLVVSSKSGSTVETDSNFRIFSERFASAGLEVSEHVVVVTDPDSPLRRRADEAGIPVITATPLVGGRYSALTAFGLVPAGLAGADIDGLLTEAAAAAQVLEVDQPDNPGLLLGAALAVRHEAGAEKVVLADAGSGIVGFPDWAEQLVSGSTGKQGIGLLPVVVEDTGAIGFSDAGPDATTVGIGPHAGTADVTTSGSLGGLFLLWEYATVVASRLIGVNPFDQPDVEVAQAAARTLLDAPPGTEPEPAPTFTDGSIEVFAGNWLAADADRTVGGAVGALLAAAPPRGYLAVQAYLDRIEDASAEVLRAEFGRVSGLQTTFGWGPRFLHSCGQYHKGGHPNGSYLQITGAVAKDLAVPDRPYTLADLQHAQALGDFRVLTDLGRPVLRLNFIDREAGLAQLARAVTALR